MSRLTVEHLSVMLGGRSILHDVSIKAEAGEMIALIGPNGAGKTSLLRAIAGLLPAKGIITINGSDAASLTLHARARLIGYLPQGHALHWPLPVRDVVALGRYPLGLRDPARASPEDRAAIDTALAQTDTAKFAGRNATTLSGGERARVALARVLALKAPIMLADEPTASLDPRHQIEVMACLADCARDGALVIVVMHDLLLAGRYCDRVVVLSEGRVHSDRAAADGLDEAMLREVFNVEAVRLSHDGRNLAIPWRAR